MNLKNTILIGTAALMAAGCSTTRISQNTVQNPVSIEQKLMEMPDKNRFDVDEFNTYSGDTKTKYSAFDVSPKGMARYVWEDFGSDGVIDKLSILMDKNLDSAYEDSLKITRGRRGKLTTEVNNGSQDTKATLNSAYDMLIN